MVSLLPSTDPAYKRTETHMLRYWNLWERPCTENQKVSLVSGSCLTLKIVGCRPKRVVPVGGSVRMDDVSRRSVTEKLSKYYSNDGGSSSDLSTQRLRSAASSASSSL